MNTAILYSVYLPNLDDKNHHNQQIFSQLYYSLKTLYDTGFDKSVFLYIDSNIDITTFIFKEKYNLVADFPKLIIVKFKYNKFLKIASKAAFHKWQCVKEFNERFSYDQILCVDNDTIFNKNPEYLFNQYSNLNAFYGVQYQYDNICEKIELLESCLNTGQFIISKNIINALKFNFLEKLLKEYFNVLCVTNKHEPEKADHMIWLGEEYAITKLLQDIDAPIIQFDYNDVQISTTGTEATLYHYYSSNTKNAVPEQYWSNYTLNTKESSYNHLS
jgi:hypothetical protein